MRLSSCRFSLRAAVGAGALSLALSLTGPAMAAGPDDPVLHLRAGLVEAGKNGWPPPAATLEALIAQDFDMATITRVVLGDSAARATPAQTARLSHALMLKVEQEIGRTRPPAANDGFVIASDRPMAGGDTLVNTRTNAPKAARGAAAQPSTTTFRVRTVRGKARIIDTVRQGVSTVQLQHDDFAGALRSHDLDGVIGLFETRAAAKPVQW